MTDREAGPPGRRDGPRSRALRQNVRLLTTMLGDAIAESGGADLLAEVEALRKAAIALRGKSTDARRERVISLVAHLGPGTRRGPDPRVHLLLPAREPRRRAPSRAHVARPEPHGQAGQGLDRSARRRSLRLRRHADHSRVDGAPDRGEATRRRRTSVADRLAPRAVGGSAARRLGGAGGATPHA